jgi:hypothetical protein
MKIRSLNSSFSYEKRWDTSDRLYTLIELNPKTAITITALVEHHRDVQQYKAMARTLRDA